ncbi:MAG TPA: MT-A70 family methyltransferase [Pseudolysinimonas sp.]|nr:MT-A70 family methyltransferase [Pseudolysinimonas sp.]
MAGNGGERHYETMSLADIKAMPIADLMEPDSWCFLWIPNGLALEEGNAVLRAWGFTPARQFITWFKGFTGFGEPLRNSTEQLLVGRIGKPKIHFRGQPTHLIAPRQTHSTKPQEQVAIVERLIGPDGLILELFARTQPSSDRWRVWGMEVESDISIPGYPVPSDFTRDQEAT